MKRYNVVQYGVIFLFVVIFLGGCASTGKISTTVPMTVKLSTYKTMLLNISSQIPESSEEMVQLESMTIAKLRDKGLFEKIIVGSSSPDAQADLRLKAKIVALKKVSSGARVMVGAMAGRAGIDVEVELFDLKESKILGTFIAQGRSSGGTVFAGTTPQAIERAVEQIVEFIQKSMQ
jgi:Domain of unknown function (DUF4410)